MKHRSVEVGWNNHSSIYRTYKPQCEQFHVIEMVLLSALSATQGDINSAIGRLKAQHWLDVNEQLSLL